LCIYDDALPSEPPSAYAAITTWQINLYFFDISVAEGISAARK
jgi:hypothetical protein